MIKGPLIVPGNYDISFNQSYLLEKLKHIEIPSFWLTVIILAFMIPIFVSWTLYVIKKYKYMKIRLELQNGEIEIEKIHQEKTMYEKRYLLLQQKEEFHKKERERPARELLDQLSIILQGIREDRMFRFSEDSISKRYYDKLRMIIRSLEPYEEFMVHKYPFLIQEYNHYKLLFKDK